jgi:NADH:ubiquinone oxidoreductase subunit 3 (subunit A)
MQEESESEESEMTEYDPALISIARRRAEMKLGFYAHLILFVLVNCVLLAEWLMNGGFPTWAFVLVFWGIGLAIHHQAAYGKLKIGAKMTERELKKLKEEGFAMSPQEAQLRRQGKK